MRLGYKLFYNKDKIYCKIPFNKHTQLISKITKQNIPNEISELKFYKISTLSENKFIFSFHNFFFFEFPFKFFANNTQDKIFNFDLELVNKLKANKTWFRIIMNNKNENKKENYDNKIYSDFPSIIMSIIPYKGLGFSFNKTFYNNSNNIDNLKISYNKIINDETNIKLKNKLKSNYLLNISNYFCFSFTNKLNIRANLILNQSNDKIKENKNNFSINNLTLLKLCNIPTINNYEYNKLFLPFFSLESSFTPNNYLKFKYNIGISLQIKDNIFLDFSFFTNDKNNNNIDNIKKKLFNFFKFEFRV